MKKTSLFLAIIALLGLSQCKKDDDQETPTGTPIVNVPDPTPYTLVLPPHFAFVNPPSIPADNPLTVEGIALGKRLFFERLLSRNNQLSCAGCHAPQFAFNDKDKALSLGIDNTPGLRNAMPLFNLAFNLNFNNHGSFNWIGSRKSIEEQAFGPVKDPLEMAENWTNVERKLQNHPLYPSLFEAAFGTPVIDSNLIVKALAQFERTLISGESRLDNYIRKRRGIPFTGDTLNAQEKRGYFIYSSSTKGDCIHCHGDLPNPLFTDHNFHNNGLDLSPDSGLAAVTKNPSDLGKFKTPSLRNLVFTAPYMHDGRFSRIEDVVEFYSSQVVPNSPNIDILMFDRGSHVANLNSIEKADLVAFLKAITDSSFVSNPAFRP